MLTAEDVASPDAGIQRVLANLEDWDFPVAQGIEFVDQDVYLDGRQFEDCSFRDCRIYITLGYFRMINPRAFIDCKFYLAGPAELMKNLVDLIEGRGAGSP